MSKTILLPIEAKYAIEIFAGRKMFEFRKFEPKWRIKKIILYATSPTCLVVGEADVVNTALRTVKEAWRLYSHSSGMSEDEFFEYYKGKERAVVFHLANPICYKQGKKLSEIGVTHAPQSFIYLPQSNTTTKL